MTVIWHQNPGAFGGLPGHCDPATARFWVLLVAYDGTSTWLKGADRGPAALLEASANMELYDIETDSEPWLSGIVTAAALEGFATPEAMVAAVKGTIALMIENDMVDAIVSTGANIVDQDFFEALGFRHYQGTPTQQPRVHSGDGHLHRLPGRIRPGAPPVAPPRRLNDLF